ncbi:putative GNAT superfamily acetyltransferase [Kitasatospora sp. MAP12-15]|uniref:GNAT family N-acetyltransferase n=1 Tax=unclassified Kitasatospora TaxID=2633591 RepID=UPI002475B6FB|nr:GNAT family N-acetyltransferase [Kitasatospora sp. MAP12-44]MDH6113694.1 putative GNAT superfamily acetyltransferase [Kitasatospora sp. MAP12-44]
MSHLVMSHLAQAAAERAALDAGVTIRELHDLGPMEEACRLFDRVWRPDADTSLMTSELLLVFSHTGSYVVGVYQGDRMVGACVGLLATVGLHSHMAAVENGTRGRSIGYALKLHQRAWALARSLTTVTWTYDPLVGRNAYFNLAKLGAVPGEYLRNFYGVMRDGLNAGVESDRLLVRWELAGERVTRACAGHPHTVDLSARHRQPVVGLAAGPDGRPVAGRLDGELVLVGVPPDIETLRLSDPQGARQWRHALRAALGELMAEGRAVTGFTRDGGYVVERY